MKHNFIAIGERLFQCTNCRMAIEFSGEFPPIDQSCESRSRHIIEECRAGCRLVRLIKFVGSHASPQCKCKAIAAEMEQHGIAWCRKNLATIISRMREEASNRKLFELRKTDSFVASTIRAKVSRDFDANAEWLILLACKLAEDNREPNLRERLRLRLMRLGNRLIGGSTVAENPERQSLRGSGGSQVRIRES